MRPWLSVVVPAFNEERRIGRTLRRIVRFLSAQKKPFEILVVDDGSWDDTVKVARSLGDRRIRVLKNERNRGKGYSVKRGMLEADGGLLLFSDADLSTPIEELPRLLSHIAEYPIVIGSRKAASSRVVDGQPPLRVLAGNLFPLIVRALMLRGLQDTQCGFKLFSRAAAQAVFPLVTIDGFSFDVEALFIAERKGLAVKEVGVRWYNDAQSKVKIIKHAGQMFLDLLRIRLNAAVGKYGG